MPGGSDIGGGIGSLIPIPGSSTVGGIVGGAIDKFLGGKKEELERQQAKKVFYKVRVTDPAYGTTDKGFSRHIFAAVDIGSYKAGEWVPTVAEAETLIKQSSLPYRSKYWHDHTLYDETKTWGGLKKVGNKSYDANMSDNDIAGRSTTSTSGKGGNVYTPQLKVDVETKDYFGLGAIVIAGLIVWMLLK